MSSHPVQRRSLIPPPGYDGRAIALCALAAQLDPLLAAVAGRVEGWSIAELEWQPGRGINTTGMLLAHMALVETFWVQAGAVGIDGDEDVDRIVRATLGIGFQDDGMPLPRGPLPQEGIVHPKALAGKTAADYLHLLRQARQATHATLRTWDDAELERTVSVDGRDLTRGWILAHIVDHFSWHAGQIALLASLRRALAGS